MYREAVHVLSCSLHSASALCKHTVHIAIRSIRSTSRIAFNHAFHNAHSLDVHAPSARKGHKYFNIERKFIKNNIKQKIAIFISYTNWKKVTNSNVYFIKWMRMKCRFIPFRPLEISRFDYERQKCQKMRFASSQSRVTLCKMIKYIKKYRAYAEK